MKDNKPRDTANMGPPRLTLVPKDGGRNPQRDAPAKGIAAAATDPDFESALDEAIDSATNADAIRVGGGESLEQIAVQSTEQLTQHSAAEIVSHVDEDADPVAMLVAQDRREKLRIIEAILFAAPEPMAEDQIARSLIEGDDLPGLMAELQQTYATRGINLIKVAGKWGFRTADDLSYLLQRYARDERRLSKAALETLAIIAYHQPVTRAEIEEIRGVSTSAGTIDILLETGWIRPRGRRRAPGRPVTYGTTENFLIHFGLDTIKDLPGLTELKGAGLLDATLPPGFSVPEPRDVAALMPDELPLEETEETSQGALDLDEPDVDDGADEITERSLGRENSDAESVPNSDVPRDKPPT